MNESELQIEPTPNTDDAIDVFLREALETGRNDLIEIASRRGLSNSSLDLYEALGASREQEETAVNFTGRLKDVWKKTSTGVKVAGGAVLATTLLRVAEEAINKSPVDIVTDLYNSATQWANYAVNKFDAMAMIIGIGGALSAVAMFNLITEAQTRIATRALERRQSLANKQQEALQAIREGRANLTGRLGPYVAHILSGIEDPATKPLADTLEQLGIESILFWDERNPLFSKGHYKNWLTVGVDGWTSRQVLEKSSPNEAVVSFGQLTLGQEAFLEQQDPNDDFTYPEEMTFDEASGYGDALNEIKEEQRLPHVFQVLLTSPDRKILGAVGASNADVYGEKTIGESINQKEQVIVDPDKYVLIEIAQQNDTDLPIELYNGPETNQKYSPRLLEAIIKHNRRVISNNTLSEKERKELRLGELKLLRFIIRDETPELKKIMEKYDHELIDMSIVKNQENADTLTLFYALDDDKTIFLAKNKYGDAIQHGSAIVIISDSEKLNRLYAPIRKTGNYICVGKIAAETEIDKFLEALVERKIAMPVEFYESLKRRVTDGSIDETLINKLLRYGLVTSEVV